MIDLILLELISLVSYIYSLILIFTSFAPINEMVLMFLWTIIVSLVFALSYKKSKLFEISILLLFLPLRFYNSKSAIFLTIVTTFFVYTYIKKSLLKTNYYEYMYKLKIAYFIYMPFIAIRGILMDLSGSIRYALIFIIIYLLSSILLTRVIRHLDSNMDIKKIRKTNIKYLVVMAVGFLIAVFDGLRGHIINFLDNLLVWIYYPLYILLGKFKITDDARKVINQVFFFKRTKHVIPGEPEGARGIGGIINEEIQNNFSIFTRMISILFILIIVCIIYILLIRARDRRCVTSEYIEEREYIREPRKKKKRFSRERYPKELKEQIRYYYRRYLEKLNKNKVEILKTDTSLQINQKAKEIFQEEIENIRKIYIDSRYGNKDIDKNIVEEMENLYKRL